MRLARYGVGICLALSVLSCKTPPPPKLEEWPETKREFRPLTFVSTINLEKGRYPDLFSKDSYAVWVDPEVAALKRSEAVAAGEEIDPNLEAEAAQITRKFLVIECHLDSVFSDMSIAYDAVGFRNLDLFLLTPDGRSIRPVQTVIDTNLVEEQSGALKRFQRTNIVIFPRQDLWVGKPTVDPSYPSVRLALQGHESTFYFEWTQAPRPEGEPKFQWPNKEQALFAARLGYTQLFTRIRMLSHYLD